jgi:hypothetical protein
VRHQSDSPAKFELDHLAGYEASTVGETLLPDPILVDPSFKHGERLIEGPAEVGYPIEGAGVDAATVQVTDDRAIAFRPSERIGENFVRDTVEGVVKVLISPSTGR